MTSFTDIELKQKLLEMMKWFHSFCLKNGIRYYVLGGTMLGAVRHHGFIPWDDDIDVGVVCEDYLKLNNLMANSGQTKYVFESPITEAPDYYYSFSKLYDTSTTLVENTRYKIQRGIYIDIFPLVGMGNNEEESLLHFKKIDKQFKYLLARSTGIRKGRNFFKNLAIRMVRMIPNCLSNDKKKLQSLYYFANSKPFYDCKYGGNPFGAWRYKEIMDRSIMGTPTLYRFEDTEVFGAENADEYLSNLYGNWMVLPSLDKRVSHHDYLKLDLTSSYREQQ
ncbi:MAG: LicD family protein [Lachnospiraceae bacterium]|nr:LicD family protein [Lachnospiraceae bacterium]